MKNEIVIIKKDNVFTDSTIVSERTENKHESIKRLITTYESQFKQFGTLTISNRESTGGRPEQYYLLNEMQATFLISLLRNNEPVVKFKVDLVQEFYRMKQFIREKQSANWQTSRQQGKQTRLAETDVIRDKLIPLAIEQGSKNYAKLYMTYSKLINSLLKIDSNMRNSLPYHYLMTIDMLERIIENIISSEVDKNTHYKEIYQVCKLKCQLAVELSFLPKLEPLKIN